MKLKKITLELEQPSNIIEGNELHQGEAAKVERQIGYACGQQK